MPLAATREWQPQIPHGRTTQMTYAGYHLIFNLPLFLLLMWLCRNRMAPAHWKSIAIVGAIAFVFTTPWDNWAVYQNMWSFDWDRTTPITIPFAGILWKLPLEEYAFFFIKTLNVSLIAILFLPKVDQGEAVQADSSSSRRG